MNSPITISDRIGLAKRSLLGTAIGDAFGDSFFGETTAILRHIEQRTIPESGWKFTDDTVMSIAVFEQIEKHGGIDQDELVKQFIKNQKTDPNRGYGATLRRLLREVQEGGNWRVLAAKVFDGMGSMGNGAAMRVSTIGAYWFDHLEKVKELTTLSAVVSHTNKEAIAGAIAIAIATALSTRSRLKSVTIKSQDFIEEVVRHLPESDTKTKIAKGLTVSRGSHPDFLITILGNGSKMLAQDTVPFAVWCAAHYSRHFEEALWRAVSVLGDRDTICAMVGGITIMSADDSTIPLAWINQVESYEASIFRSTTV
ncbi:MAG: crystallin J1 [Roseivirga sp.]|nr:crystallin J1 [Roseivirga sp.]